MSSESTMKESNVDVLIIGAGPAGLMASNAFAAAGVNVRVVDKRCVRKADVVIISLFLTICMYL